MRPLFFKELKELTLLGIPMVIVMAVAASETVGTRDMTEDILVVVLVAGAALGVWHALLDRLRRDDSFLRHRPVSAARFHLARTLAGLTTCLYGAIAFLVFFEIFTALQADRIERWSVAVAERVGSMRELEVTAFRLDASGSFLAVAAMVGAWAVVRLALAIRQPAAAIGLALLLPLAAWSIASRAPSVNAAGTTFLVIAAICAVMSVVNLSGETR